MKNSKIHSDTKSIDSKLLIIPTGKTLNDLETCREIAVETPGDTLEEDLGSISTKLGSRNGYPTDIHSKISTRITELNNDSNVTTLEYAISSISAVISSIDDNVMAKLTTCINLVNSGETVLKTCIDESLGLSDDNSGIPALKRSEGNYFKILKVISWVDNNGIKLTVKEVSDDGIVSNTAIEFSNQVSIIVATNDLVRFENGKFGQYIDFTYRGLDIVDQNNQNLILSYFTTMYPVNSYLSNNLNDIISNNIFLCLG